jgi:hypothetical protein
MSYPYPEDRTREKRNKGDQPYEDDREAYAEKQARIERTAPLPPEEDIRRTQEEQEQEAEQRLEQIAEDVAERRD